MGLVRIYTKPQGQQPDFTDPVVLSAVCYPNDHFIICIYVWPNDASYMFYKLYTDST